MDINMIMRGKNDNDHLNVSLSTFNLILKFLNRVRSLQVFLFNPLKKKLKSNERLVLCNVLPS